MRSLSAPLALLSVPLIVLAAYVINLGTGSNQPAIATPYSSQKLKSVHPVSQIPRSSQSTQQGRQIIFNGRPFVADWSQWQTGDGIHTGISDASLMQTVGVELLNTETVAQQPIQWFSDFSSNPLNLSVHLTGPLRYLDIANLAEHAGWQVQTIGNSLHIASPAAKVTAIRQTKQPWGDRLVIELDRPAVWQVDQSSQEFILALDAQIDSTLLSSFKPNLSEQVSSLQIEPIGNQTRLVAGLPISLHPRVWSLPNPNRLVVDIRPDSLPDRDILWAPGLHWRSQILSLGDARFPIVWLAVNPSQAGVSLAPILSNPGTAVGIAPLAQTARSMGVAAAINGGFFNRNNQLSLGAIRRDGRWISGPILNRGAIAWDNAGNFKFDRLTLQETLVTQTGQRLPLTHLNSGYIQAGIGRYTSDWGPVYLPLSDNEILVTVQNNRVTNKEVIAAAGSKSVDIPSDGYLLVLRSSKSKSNALTIGTSLRLESITTPVEFNRFPQVLAAGPLLMQNRQIVLNTETEKFSKAFATERASRSAIGQLADGTLLIAAVHNRLDGKGITLVEVAQLMQQLGAINALNLDGGSSTTLYMGGQILDRPLKTTARVQNGLGIYIQPNP